MRTSMGLFLSLLVLTAAAAPATKPRAWLGFSYTIHTFAADAPVRQWLYVQKIAEGGPAMNSGLHVQDAIIAINGVAVDFPTAKAALEYFRATKPGAVLKLEVIRQEKRIIVSLRSQPMPGEAAADARNEDLARREDSARAKRSQEKSPPHQ